MTSIENVPGAGISVSGTQITLESQLGGGESPDDRKLRKAAGDFESILLASMWKSMKQSFGTTDSEFGSDPAHGTLEDWGIEVMSSAVGRAGGLGIGKLILKQLEPHVTAEKSSISAHSPKVQASSADITMEETTRR
jgi:Rod binding domain-containing protein